MLDRRGVYCRLVGGVSGVMLGLPNIFGLLAPLQMIALVPIFLFVGKDRYSKGVLLMTGMYMGLGFSLPQMAVLKLPAPITAILFADFVAVMMIFVLVSSKLLEKPTVLKAIGIGAFFVVLDWVNYTAVPIWGTAQSFARSWSWYPSLVAFESITGMAGVVFIVAAVQALAVSGWICPQLRRRAMVAGAVILVATAGLNLTAMHARPADKLKVAAVGWKSRSFEGEIVDITTPEVFDEIFAAPVAKASRAGAVLAVTPEMGFYVDRYDYDQWLEKIKATAVENEISLAVGYFNAELNQNRMMFVSSTGQVLDEYTKTYLTVFENFEKGSGDLKVVEVGEINIGGMICQDDNFTSLSRIYGKMGISLVAVPTLDWRPVRNAHLQNSIHRAIESRYAVVRAARDGISAIIAPYGRVIEKFDHVENGPGMVIAEVDVYRCKTVFSRFGNWFVLLCAISIVFCWMHTKKTHVAL